MKLIDLQEGRDAPLYHGTTIYQFLNIYATNKLIGHNTPDQMGKVKSVRTSRDWLVAAELGQDMDISGVVVVLDQAKLSQRFKIVPFADQRGWTRHNGGSESEEVIITNAIYPLSDYVINYKVDPESLVYLLDEFPTVETDKYLRGWSLDDVSKVVDAIQKDPRVVKFGGIYL